MNKIAAKKFEILDYVSTLNFTIDGLADKLNELTRLCDSSTKNKRFLPIQARSLLHEYTKNNNMRNTKERMSVLNHICGMDDFIVEDLYIQMKVKGIRISRATIYNTMDIFIKLKLVTQVFENDYRFRCVSNIEKDV